MARTRCRAPGRTTPTSATSRTRSGSGAYAREPEGPPRAALPLRLLWRRLCPRSGAALERQVAAVHDIHDVVVPTIALGLHQVLVDVEVQRDERVIAQHHALGLLEQRAPLRRVGFGRRALEQRVVGRALV